MTNREKLSKIIDDWHVCEDNFNSDEKRQLLLDIEKDLELLDKYRELVREYASLKGRNLTISIEEVVNDFRELENDK